MTPSMGNSGAATGSSTGLKGTGYRQIQSYTPEQVQLFQRLFGNVGPDSHLSRLASGDQSEFEQLEAPAKRQFNETLGGIASKFGGGVGASREGSSRRSSGFNNTVSQAATNFAENLQSQRLGLRQNALQDLMNMSQQLLGNNPYGYLLEEQQKKPMWQSLVAGGAPLVGAGIGGFFGGPAGAALGGSLGGAVGRAFG